MNKNIVDNLRALQTGIVQTGTCLALILSQNVMHWIKFLQNKIPSSSMVFASLATFIISYLLSFIMSKNLDDTTYPKTFTTDYSKTTSKITYKAAIFRWILYNIFGLAFAGSWAAYLMVHNHALFNETFFQYAIIAFIIVNTMFLLAQSLLKNGTNSLETFILAAACGGSFFGCNRYFPPLEPYNTATNTGVLIVGAVIMALTCYIIFCHTGLDRDNNDAKNSSRVNSSAAFVCLILNGVAFGFCGLGVAYSAEGILTADVVVPMIVIGALTAINFLAANVAQHRFEIPTSTEGK